jgi:hypothetical protein
MLNTMLAGEDAVKDRSRKISAAIGSALDRQAHG